MDEAERIRRADRVRAVFDVYGLKPSRANRDELIKRFRQDAAATLPMGRPLESRSTKGPHPLDVLRDVVALRREAPRLNEWQACQKLARKYGMTDEAVRSKYREAWDRIEKSFDRQFPLGGPDRKYAGAKGRKRMPVSMIEYLAGLVKK